MEKFKRFVDIDYSQFEGDDLEALYGLPKKIQFCKKCVISNQRPNSCEEYKNGKDYFKRIISKIECIEKMWSIYDVNVPKGEKPSKLREIGESGECQDKYHEMGIKMEMDSEEDEVFEQKLEKYIKSSFEKEKWKDNVEEDLEKYFRERKRRENQRVRNRRLRNLRLRKQRDVKQRHRNLRLRKQRDVKQRHRNLRHKNQRCRNQSYKRIDSK